MQKIAAFVLLPIGDTLFCTPALHCLREAYPQATIHALTFPNNRAVLTHSPDVDGLITYPTRQTWAKWGVLRLAGLFGWLHRQRYDLVVEFCPAIGWLSLLTKPRRRAWAHHPPLWWTLPGSPAIKRWRKLHAVQIFNRPLELDLGLRVPPEPRPHLYLQPAHYAAADAVLHQHGIVPGREMVVTIHPGGEGVGGQKRWPAAGFAALADGLVQRYGARVLITGGPEDREIAMQVIANTRLSTATASHHLISLIGRTKLLESAAIIALSDLFIGNDSSPLHIAASLGTPCVGIYGPTSLDNYRPYLPLSERGRTWEAVTPDPYRPHAYFVGGVPIWRKVADEERSAGIATIPATAVLDAACRIADCKL